MNPMVTIEMENGGKIVLELYPDIAPISVDNFISLAQRGYYDGLIFHRVIDGFMIQGGCPDGTGMGNPGYSIKGEFAKNGVENNLKHTPGVISMARSQDMDSGGSQFFIMHKDKPTLDGSYAAFGKLVEGQDIVDAIAECATDRQDRPIEPQVMKKVTVQVQSKALNDQRVADFQKYMDRIIMFRQAMSVMSFDASTIAPKGGVEQRAKRSGFFELELYNMRTSDTMKKFLDDLAPVLDDYGQDIKSLHRIVKKEYDKETKLPAELVKEFAELQEEANQVWDKAKQENDFKSFEPYLVRLIDMAKKTLEYRKDEIPAGGVPYDVLLDDFEEGMTIEKYEPFFEGLKEIVVPLIKKVLASEKKIETFEGVHVDKATQEKIAAFLANKVG